MQLLLFKNFSKRRNSTKQVDDSTGIVTDVVLKQGTSIESPVFLIQGVDLEVNYVKFNNHYFFIDDIIVGNNNIYELHCSQDLLATYKTQIRATRCNILYASGADVPGIIDKRIPVLTNMNVHENAVAVSSDASVSISTGGRGAVVLGITGKGSMGSYLLESNSFVSDLLNDVDGWYDGSVTTTLEAAKQFIYGGSAGECLKSAIGIPLLFSPTKVSTDTNAQPLVLGNYPCKRQTDSGTVPIGGYSITEPVLSFTNTVKIPWENSETTYRMPPFSSVYLYLPLIGMITLPTADIILEKGITVVYCVNITSGDISVEYKGSTSGRIIGTASGNCAMAMPFGNTGINTSKLTNGVLAGAGAVATGIANIATGGAAGVAALGIGGGLATVAASTIASLGGTGNGSGGLGGGASHKLDAAIHCYVVSHYQRQAPSQYNDIMGKPFMAVSTPGAFSGFVMTEGFSINIDGLGNDKEVINSAMDKGVYIE